MKVARKVGRKFSMVLLILAFGVLACLQNMKAGCVSSGQIKKEIKAGETNNEDYVMQPSLILITDY